MIPDIDIILAAQADARTFHRQTPTADAQEAAFALYAALEPSSTREPRSVQLERYRTAFALELVRLRKRRVRAK